MKGEAGQSGMSLPAAEQPLGFRWLMQRLSIRLRFASDAADLAAQPLPAYKPSSATGKCKEGIFQG